MSERLNIHLDLNYLDLKCYVFFLLKIKGVSLMYENKQKNNEYAMKNFKLVDPEGNNYE